MADALAGRDARRGDFRIFFAGQALSAFGSAVTNFALPLLVYELSHSPTQLAAAFATSTLPYLLFGLVGGALADRLDRKRLMIRVDLARALLLASVPALAVAHTLPLWWLYAVGFLAATLGILFDAADFAALPSLVGTADLVSANGRITAAYTAADLLGPPLGGLLATAVPLPDLLLVDALTFAASAVALAAVRTPFNAAAPPPRGGLRADIGDGLRFVWGHPVLRHIALMMALVNFVTATQGAQLVLFVKGWLGATDVQYGLVVAGGSLGVLLLSLAAGALRRRFAFGRVALGTLALSGVLGVGFALATNYWAALLLWLLIPGLGALFNINVNSLRQAIVPGHLLGRVISTARVLAFSTAPLGALLGGALVDRAGVVVVYAGIGALRVLIPLGFALSPLGRAGRDPAETRAAGGGDAGTS